MARIIALDCGRHDWPANVSWAEFADHRRLVSYDVIVWDVVNTYSYYRSKTQNESKGQPLLENHLASRFLERYESRADDFKAVLENGGSIVCFLSPVETFSAELGGRSFKNMRLSAATGVQDVPDAIAGEGYLYDVCAGEPFKTFASKAGRLVYIASLPSPAGEAFLRIKGSDEIAATRFRHLNGNVLFVPRYFPPDDNQARMSFFDAIGDLCDTLRQEAGAVVQQPPDWLTGYRFEVEDSLAAELSELEHENNNLLRAIEEKQSEIKQWRDWKILLYGYDKPLEGKVAEAFQVLGFTIQVQSVTNEADLVIQADEQPVVAEVKGITGSAAQKHARALEQWALSYAQKHDVHPKPILVVNAYRDTPLDERTEPVFPDQMLQFSTDRKHCLLTTTQLLVMVLACLRKPEDAINFRKLVLNTVGRFEGYDDITSIFGLDGID